MSEAPISFTINGPHACSLGILAVRHFDPETGLCRCTDPMHVEMAEWGYTWDAAERRWKMRP